METTLATLAERLQMGPEEQRIPGLQYLLYIEQGRPFVTLFERISGTARWRSTDYDALDQSLPLGDFALEMRDAR